MNVAVYYYIQNSVGWLCSRHQYCINNVNHSVVGDDISYDYLCVVDEYTASVNGYCYICTIQGCDHLTV